MAMIETVVRGDEVPQLIVDELVINEYNSIRVFYGEEEISFDDLKVVIYEEDEEENEEEKGIPCIYCNQNPSTHFLCDSCGAGMCDECYETNEHTEHYNKPLEECEVKYIDAIKKVCNSEDPQYICEACMKKALSMSPQDFADDANKILKKTSFRAIIVETSELYGANDEEDIEEDNPFYMEPMYEGYIEDDWGNEINDTRTSRYCSLGDVGGELVAFAKNQVQTGKCIYCEDSKQTEACGNDNPNYICESCMTEVMTKGKLAFIKEDLEKLVGTRWERKKDLEKHLNKIYEIDSQLSDVDESGLANDYAFTGLITNTFGSMDIYYLKIPYGEDTIYITEVSASED